MFFAANTEERLPKNHPLRVIKRSADGVLKTMKRVFDDAYSQTGKPGIAPEALVKANLNNLLGAGEYGVVNMNSGKVDATRNWWGCAGGPMSGGSGCSTITGSGVFFAPWLGEATP